MATDRTRGGDRTKRPPGTTAVVGRTDPLSPALSASSRQRSASDGRHPSRSQRSLNSSMSLVLICSFVIRSMALSVGMTRSRRVPFFTEVDEHEKVSLADQLELLADAVRIRIGRRSGLDLNSRMHIACRARGEHVDIRRVLRRERRDPAALAQLASYEELTGNAGADGLAAIPLLLVSQDVASPHDRGLTTVTTGRDDDQGRAHVLLRRTLPRSAMASSFDP